MVFSERELKIIRIWGDTVIHGGHWGDGDVVFPDENNLLNTLDGAVPGEELNITKRDAEILRIWSDCSTGTPEEEVLVHRIAELSGAG